MGVYLTQRVRDLQGWIPPEDIDGIDVPRNRFVEYARNVHFENGYLRNVKVPVERPLPFTLLIEEINDIYVDENDDYYVDENDDKYYEPISIADGESLISAKHFVHSTRGNVWFYVIWNREDNEYKFYVEDDFSKGYVNPDEASSNITGWVETSLDNISYNAVDDSLKINLNQVITYEDIDSDKDVIANFSLQYLPAFLMSSFPGVPIFRLAGWYLFPRWLGWSYLQSGLIRGGEIDNTHIGFDTSYDDGKQSFETVTKSNTLWESTGGYEEEGKIRVGQLDDEGNWIFGTDRYAAEVSFYVKIPTVNGEPDQIWAEIRDGATDSIKKEVIQISGEYPVREWTKVTIPISYDEDTENGFYIHIYAEFVYVDDFRVDYNNTRNCVVLAHNLDQQRGIVYTGEVNNDSQLRIYKKEMDWRVREYELYVEDPDSGIYYLRKTIGESDDTNYWNIESDYYWHDIGVLGIPEVVTTLNFNYGLGASTLPYKEDEDTGLIGDVISDEAYYRGRVYYVKGNSNIYMSHLAGSGRVQSDSFPVNEEIEFGFIKGDNSQEVFKALSVTPLDELAVISNDQLVVYTIQAGANAVYRKIKVINGASGIYNRRSLIKDVRGRPVAEVLLWTNRYGIYIYGGGIRAPINLAMKGMINHWKTKDYTKAVSMYNPIRNEFIIGIGTEAIVYEIDTQSWKRYEFSETIQAFVGIKDNEVYVLTFGNKISRITEDTSTYYTGAVITHWSTDYFVAPDGNPAPVAELQDKIAQQIYVSTRNVGDTAVFGAWINIYINDVLITPSIYFGADNHFEEVMSHLLLRYKKIKLELILMQSDIEVREFGHTFSIPQSSPGQSIHSGKSGTGFGQSFGSEFGIHL